jgi:hypothetical protein
MSQQKQASKLLSGLAATSLLAITACSSALGIEDAHVDPSFSPQPGKASVVKTKDAGSGAVCKAFDNHARLANLMPDGSLAPLPAH